jgi:hypothetical protein
VSADPVVSWLEAELGRVEELARAAGDKDGWWVIAPRYSDPRFVNGVPPTPEDCAILNVHTGPVVYVEVGDAVGKEKRMGEAMLIQANNPAAVLRRVKADRAILAEHANDGCGDCTVCAQPSEEYNGVGAHFHEPLPWPCRTVRLLAEAWGWEGRPNTERAASTEQSYG